MKINNLLVLCLIMEGNFINVYKIQLFAIFFFIEVKRKLTCKLVRFFLPIKETNLMKLGAKHLWFCIVETHSVLSLLASKATTEEVVISNGHCVTANHGHGRKSICSGNNNSVGNSVNSTNSSQNSLVTALSAAIANSLGDNSRSSAPYSELRHAVDKLHDYQYMETAKQTVINDYEDSDDSCEKPTVLRSNGVACHAAPPTGRGGKWGGHASVKDNLSSSASLGGSKRNHRNSAKEVAAVSFGSQKDDHTYRWVCCCCSFFSL